MTAIASTDVTVTLAAQDIDFLGTRKRVSFPTIAFGDAALTYPAHGVPLPAVGNFGMKQAISRVFIEGQPGDGYTYKYDRTYHTIRIYQGAGFTPSGTISAPVFTGTPVTPTGTNSAPVFTGASITPAGTVAAPVFTGTPDTPTGTVAAPVFTGAAATMASKMESWSIQNILGADANVATSETVDELALPTNSARIDTAAAVAVGAWTYSEDNEIDVPRNVNIVLINDTGGDIVMEDGVTSFLVTGTFRGAAQTDTISFTLTGGTRTITHAPSYRWKYGVKPFETITSVVATGLTATQNGLKISVGLGRLLGVPQNTKDGVAGDFVKVVKNAANQAVAAYSDTNKTLDVGALADNDDLDITYETAGLESYTPAGTNSAPAFTGVAMTPVGTNSAPAFTGTPVTPTGTVAAPVFTGAAITPAGTNSVPIFTGAAVAAGVLVELGAVAVAATTLYLMVVGQ